MFSCAHSAWRSGAECALVPAGADLRKPQRRGGRGQLLAAAIAIASFPTTWPAALTLNASATSFRSNVWSTRILQATLSGCAGTDSPTSAPGPAHSCSETRPHLHRDSPTSDTHPHLRRKLAHVCATSRPLPSASGSAHICAHSTAMFTGTQHGLGHTATEHSLEWRAGCATCHRGEREASPAVRCEAAAVSSRRAT